MKTIYKYVMDELGSGNFSMPEGSDVLKVGYKDGSVCLWALVDTLRPMAPRSFIYVGTGHQIPNHAFQYIGTAVGEEFVWHVFEV